MANGRYRNRLRELCAQIGFTQTDLWLVTGIPRTTINKYWWDDTTTINLDHMSTLKEKMGWGFDELYVFESAEECQVRESYLKSMDALKKQSRSRIIEDPVTDQ